MLSNVRTGFTLVEVMVAGSVALLLLGLLVRFLVPAMRYTAEGNIRVDMQQQALIALNQMTAELQRSAPSGISFRATAPVALGIVAIDDIDGAGRPVWDNQALVYHFDSTSQTLVKETYPPANPDLGKTFLISRPTDFTPNELANLAGTANGSEKTLARGVIGFLVGDSDPTPGLQPPIVLELQLEKEVPHTAKRASVTMTRRVFLRNP